MKLATWNINSVRLRLPLVLQFLQDADIEVLWNIKIRFSRDVAKRAEKVQFHPLQKISHGRNGSLVIEMRCIGHRELIWELMHPDWIGHVKIESPEGLQKEYLEQLVRGKTAVHLI